MKTTKIPRLFALLILIFIPAVTPAFDCGKATKAIEFLICQTPDLKQQDDEMTALFHHLVAKQIPLTPQQSDWLHNPRNVCPDVNCLRKVYASRIGYFKSLLAAPPPSPAPVNAPPVTSMPEEFSGAVETAQGIIQAKPVPVNPITPPPVAAINQVPVTNSAAVTTQPAQNLASPNPAIKPTPPPEKPPLISGQTLKHLFLWLVFFAALFGLYKASRLPEARQFLSSSLFKLRVYPEYFVQGRRLSLLRVFLIILPIVALTLWLLYNVIDIIAAGAGFDLFHAQTQPLCSLPPQPTSPVEFYQWQIEAQNYIQQHPECASPAFQPGGRSRFMDMMESKGFLLPYYFWALPFALYLNYRLFLKKKPLNLKGLVLVLFILSMAFSPVPLSLLWPLLPGLPKTPGWVSFLLMGPVPPLVMLTFGTAAITVFFGGIFSLISAIALPVVALFNQINMFMITRHRHELQAGGVYVWLIEFEHWLTNTPMPPLPPDDSKGARFATHEEIAAILAPPSLPSFEKGEARP